MSINGGDANGNRPIVTQPSHVNARPIDYHTIAIQSREIVQHGVSRKIDYGEKDENIEEMESLNVVSPNSNTPKAFSSSVNMKLTPLEGVNRGLLSTDDAVAASSPPSSSSVSPSPPPSSSVYLNMSMTSKGGIDECEVVVPPPKFTLRLIDVGKSVGRGSSRVEIIRGINGTILAGRMCMVIGPFGSGKTTLLDCIADRSGEMDMLTHAQRQGTITMNGQVLTDKHRARIGYVYQREIFFENYTVQELMTMHARIVKPHDSNEMINDRISMILSSLFMSYSRLLPLYLLSPGHRRLIGVGIALLQDVSILLIDDLTTGLDAAATLTIVYALKRLANQGTTIIAAMHQPSYRVLMAFDDMFLLSRGECVYSGSVHEAIPYFSSLGYYCPLTVNPAEYLLECIVYDVRDRDYLVNKYNELCLPHARRFATEKHVWTHQDDQAENYMAIESERKSRYSHRWQVLKVLFKRYLRLSTLKAFTWSSMIQAILLSIIMGLSWYHLSTNEADVGDRIGLVFIVTGYWLFQCAFAATSTYALEYIIIQRELAQGLYRYTDYFLGKMFAESLCALPLPVVFTVIYYWMASVNQNFGEFVSYTLVQLMMVLASESMGLLIGSLTLNLSKSSASMTVILYGLMCVGGFYVRNLPSWLSWTKWLSIFTYGYHASLEAEFPSTRVFHCDGSYIFTQCYNYYYVGPSSTLTFTGADIQDYLSIRFSQASNVGILVLFIVGYRAAAYGALRYALRVRPAITNRK